VLRTLRRHNGMLQRQLLSCVLACFIVAPSPHHHHANSCFQAQEMELAVLVGLDWRLGPHFDLQ
jgi:hypothetical protein